MNLKKTISILKKEDYALETLSEALTDGYLSLFIGAGVSKSATNSFPDWYKLVERCCLDLNLDFERNTTSNKYLRQQMETVESACQSTGKDYVDFVKTHLYKDVDYSLELMKTDLLISLGSLVMGSVRGNAKAVINYNYDDLLEWYLEFHGFRTQVISNYPVVTQKADVKIYHPHGFLPFDTKFENFKSDKIILSQKSYLDSYAEVDSWNEFQIGQLSCNLGLFIGLSGEDEHIELLCNRAYERVKKSDHRTIIGYIILKDTEKNRALEKIHENRGLINLYIRNYDELPTKLLEITRHAANISISNT